MAVLVWVVLHVQAERVEQYCILELSFKGPSAGNPFTEVQFSAEFKYLNKTFFTEGFYDGEGLYRVRFMPDHAGDWSYTTTSNVPALNGKTVRNAPMSAAAIDGKSASMMEDPLTPKNPGGAGAAGALDIQALLTDIRAELGHSVRSGGELNSFAPPVPSAVQRRFRAYWMRLPPRLRYNIGRTPMFLWAKDHLLRRSVVRRGP